ncbi:PREDICTED: uncharacterized protein LOC105155048 isoform X1 [Acromyrmex echinatior]|uniref:uncharacterized protein LOC105155048 isoform X1 n=1 Tax=Acromyrmex echinatior TaxID=103372 RepID=UPI000580FA16|nr:PREDICTED: uncharacterized protein LOC105155048 isoform X1 [Acromyrmex echinatior]
MITKRCSVSWMNCNVIVALSTAFISLPTRTRGIFMRTTLSKEYIKTRAVSGQCRGIRCLHYFSSNAKLENHAIDCEKLNNCAIRLPSKDDKWLSFGNYIRKERIPFVVYTDLNASWRRRRGISKRPATRTSIIGYLV